MTKPAELDEALRRARAAAGKLQAVPPTQRGALLAEAAQQIVNAQEELGRRTRAALLEETGLSSAMIDWGLRTTLDEVTVEAVTQLCNNADGAPIDLVGVVLAGNIFAAAVRGCWAPLALGVPVVVKPSSRHDAMPRTLVEAWRRSAPSFAEAFQIAAFEGGSQEHEQTLLEYVDALSVYGSDDTIAQFKSRPANAVIIEHGHGIGAAFIDEESLAASRIDDVASRIALDVVAYDQRGCLSPHLIYVQGPDLTLFAQALRRAVESLDDSLPMGAVPIDVRAETNQWRGVAQATGDLLHTDTIALALRNPNQQLPIRPTPGHRHVDIRACHSLEDAVGQLSTLGSHLKCVGVSPSRVRPARDAFALHDTPLPRVCEHGTMQRPTFDAWADGHPAWHGLVKHR